MEKPNKSKIRFVKNGKLSETYPEKKSIEIYVRKVEQSPANYMRGNRAKIMREKSRKFQFLKNEQNMARFYDDPSRGGN